MIVEGLNAIVEFISKFFDLLLDALKWVLDGALYVIKAGLFFCVDGLLTVVVSIVGSLDLGNLVASAAGHWAGLPPQLLYIINAVGLPTCISMLCYAILIRMLLNLIPAALTRI